MARNLIGYFAGKPDCKQYSVKIITDESNDTFEEISLAGDSPFVVTYDTSKTPFDPIRFSRASINVVADEKFLDVFSEEAQGTKVILTDESGGTIEWMGFLTSNLIAMPDTCGNSTFTLEAQDCLSTLENYDYQLIGSKKAIVNFRKILQEICDRAQISRAFILLASTVFEDYSISEQNFFSSDTDEPWNLRQVLEEFCRFFGFTAVQWKHTLYLWDYQGETDRRWSSQYDNQINDYWTNGVTMWKIHGHWTATVAPAQVMPSFTLKQDYIMGSDSDISLEALYNKIQVKDSFYEVKEFIPDIFADELLTNRAGDFWQCNQIGGSGKLRYINKNGKSKKEEKDENEHIYYQRKFDHQNYESVYRDKSNMSTVTTGNPIRLKDIEAIPNTYVEEGWGEYNITATFTNTDSVSHIIDVHAFLKYEWWDGEAGHMGEAQSDSAAGWTAFTLTAGQSQTINMSLSASFSTDFMENCTFDVYYTVEGDPKHYPLSQGTEDTRGYIGGTIVDLATFDKPMSTAKYNYETESNISFDRYLMIHQCDKPDNLMHPYWRWLFFASLNPIPDYQIEQYWPCVFRLKSGYTNPIIYDNKAYLSIDARAIFERYDREYVNPDWTKDNTRDNGVLGLLNKTHGVTTCVPALIFKLKVGGKYYSSQSGWTERDCCFVVNLGTDKTDKDDVDFTAWWNTEHPVLNNVSWTDWAGVSGYKIPLDPSFDMNQEIIFEVHLPTKMQSIDRKKSDYDGINNYCWVKDLKMSFATKDSENYKLADVLYENVIDSGSVNTLSDITCKLTTYPGQGMHSYSNVGVRSGNSVNLLQTLDIKSYGYGVAGLTAEELIVWKYNNQYATPTIKQTKTLDLTATPFSRIKDPTIIGDAEALSTGKFFMILGQTIDYAQGSQNVTLIESKYYMDYYPEDYD